MLRVNVNPTPCMNSTWTTSARFDRMERGWEKQRREPDDVFFHARDRKEQIK